MGMSLAHNVWAAEAVKKELKIPVIASGSINLPDLAEKILADGKGDFIGLGRPLWADPEWPRKAMEGRPEDIRPCIRCNDGCLARGDHLAKTVSCSVNVAVCREDVFEITKTDQPRKVAVVGGGPAGMEAARVCALKGHRRHPLREAGTGGRSARGLDPGIQGTRPEASHRLFQTQLGKLGIKVIKEEATLAGISEAGYDAVIVAAGATALALEDVPGITDEKVTGASQVLRGEARLGQTVAVIGGGIVGTEVGLFVAEQGKEVVFVEMLDTFMNNITSDEKLVYEGRFEGLKVSIHTGRRLAAVTDDGVTVMDRFGKETKISVDSVVLAAGFRPNRELLDSLMNDPKLKVFEAGDCVRPRKIFDAIHDGHIAAKLVD